MAPLRARNLRDSSLRSRWPTCSCSAMCLRSASVVLDAVRWAASMSGSLVSMMGSLELERVDEERCKQSSCRLGVDVKIKKDGRQDVAFCRYITLSQCNTACRANQLGRML